VIPVPRVEPATGTLVLAPATFDALAAFAADPAAARGDHRLEPHLAAVENAGLLSGDSLDPGLGATLEPVVAPVCRLALRHEAHHSRGWVSSVTASLLVPADAELRRLVRLHPSFLPEALAKLAALGPRTRGATPSSLRIPEATFEHLVRTAALDSDAVERARDATPGGGQAPPSVGRVRGSWSVEAEWLDSVGETRGRRVEVLDTEQTLWMLRRTGSEVELSPTSPTAVWRALAGLLPSDGDLRAGPSRRPAAPHA